MADISASVVGTPRNFHFQREGVAQADDGQVDYIAVPQWARFAKIVFNLTAVAGTSPTAVFSIQETDPVALDDTYNANVRGHTAFTTITAAAQLVVDVGPGVRGSTDDVTTSATGTSQAALNGVLPNILALSLVFDRTTGDETYTYSLTVTFS